MNTRSGGRVVDEEVIIRFSAPSLILREQTDLQVLKSDTWLHVLELLNIRDKIRNQPYRIMSSADGRSIPGHIRQWSAGLTETVGDFVDKFKRKRQIYCARLTKPRGVNRVRFVEQQVPGPSSMANENFENFETEKSGGVESESREYFYENFMGGSSTLNEAQGGGGTDTLSIPATPYEVRTQELALQGVEDFDIKRQVFAKLEQMSNDELLLCRDEILKINDVGRSRMVVRTPRNFTLLTRLFGIPN